ncbi:RNA polymerase sigma factor [Streptomyces mirabilis]|uniref:RNA polymerase sigma factor n=1 Tax=Streptomyces mirabilis TaxID=68239 RepID=UPI0036E6D3B4
MIVATETTGVERTGPVVELSLRDRIRAGDPEAFAELFGALARAVHGHAARLSADRGTAEDVVSLTFLEAWRLREKLRPEAAALDEGRRALPRGREDPGRLGRHRRQGPHRPLRHRPEFQGARRPHGLGLRQEVPRLPGLGGRGAAGCRGRGQGRRDAGPMIACSWRAVSSRKGTGLDDKQTPRPVRWARRGSGRRPCRRPSPRSRP